MVKYFPMVKCLEQILSEDELVVLNNALWAYYRSFDVDSGEDESIVALKMAYAFDWYGYNPIVE